MRQFAVVLPIIIALIAGLCAPTPSHAAKPTAKLSSAQADVASIRAAGKRWASLYTAGRFAEIPDLYTVDTIVMPRGRPRIEGREAMRRAIGGLAAGRRVNIAVAEREVRAIGNYGWYLGDFNVTYTPTNSGAVPVTEVGRSLIIYRRDRDGAWRVHRDIDSSAPQLAQTAPMTAIAPSSDSLMPALWDPKTRTIAVECDRLTASRYDRTRLAPSVARDAIDVPRAIAACEADLARLPGDPRILFQLGRLYGYSGDAAKTLAIRRAAAAAGNHNAIFLLGYLDFQNAKDDDARCAAARQMKLAADRRNYSAQLSYASYLLEGKLDACPNRASNSEAVAYVAAARPVVDGFFETRLADHLAAELKTADGTAARARLIAQMAGSWVGTFRRYDPEGVLTEALPSEVIIAFNSGAADYRQTNILRRSGKPDERVETTGRWDGDRLRFANSRVEGWFGPLEGDTTGLASVLQLTFKGPNPMTMSEVLTVSPDGQTRMRIAQYVVGGKIVRRTMIDETRKK